MGRHPLHRRSGSTGSLVLSPSVGAPFRRPSCVGLTAVTAVTLHGSAPGGGFRQRGRAGRFLASTGALWVKVARGIPCDQRPTRPAGLLLTSLGEGSFKYFHPPPGNCIALIHCYIVRILCIFMPMRPTCGSMIQSQAPGHQTRTSAGAGFSMFHHVHHVHNTLVASISCLCLILVACICIPRHSMYAIYAYIDPPTTPM